MAESEQQPEVGEGDAPSVAYKPPAEKSIDEIANTDAEDESLRKYKEQLLGNIEDRIFCKFVPMVSVAPVSQCVHQFVQISCECNSSNTTGGILMKLYHNAWPTA